MLYELAEKVSSERPELSEWAYKLVEEGYRTRRLGEVEAALRCALGERFSLHDLHYDFGVPRTLNKLRRLGLKKEVFGLDPVVSKGEFREFVEELPDYLVNNWGVRMKEQLLRGFFVGDHNARGPIMKIGKVMYVPTIRGEFATYRLVTSAIRGVPNELLAEVGDVDGLVELALDEELAFTSLDVSLVGGDPRKLSYPSVSLNYKVFFPSDDCKLWGRFDSGFLVKARESVRRELYGVRLKRKVSVGPA